MYAFLLAAIDRQWAIGREGHMPWPHLSEDIRWFANFTTFAHLSKVRANRLNMVVMGRRTYDSLPARVRPLPNRITIVVTHRTLPERSNLYFVNSYRKAWDLALHLHRKGIGDCLMVAGGASCYLAFANRIHAIILTQINAIFLNCDTFFPCAAFDWSAFELRGNSPRLTDHNIEYTRYLYLKKNSKKNHLPQSE